MLQTSEGARRPWTPWPQIRRAYSVCVRKSQLKCDLVHGAPTLMEDAWVRSSVREGSRR